jgi:hypothetical protein
MEGFVYILCAVTALLCAVLLFRGYRRTKTRLLLVCGLFFLSLTLENVIVFIDVVMVPHIDLFMIRGSVALIGMIVLLAGLIWDVR